MYVLSAMLPTGHKYGYMQELIIRKMTKDIINPLFNYLLITLNVARNEAIRISQF